MSTSQDLKSAGLKATLPRLKIINLFETSKVRHLTAEDVYKLLLAEGLDIGLATVYRVLTQFEQAGLLVRHHFESGKAVFELNEGKHHDHLVCMQCGRVEEFYDAEIEKRQTRIAKDRGFEISEHALYIYAGRTELSSRPRRRQRARESLPIVRFRRERRRKRRLAAAELREPESQRVQDTEVDERPGNDDQREATHLAEDAGMQP
jgi:Fur family ferric uptake transcriptional regulator